MSRLRTILRPLMLAAFWVVEEFRRVEKQMTYRRESDRHRQRFVKRHGTVPANFTFDSLGNMRQIDPPKIIGCGWDRTPPGEYSLTPLWDSPEHVA